MINKVEALVSDEKNSVKTREHYKINTKNLMVMILYLISFFMGRAVVFDGLAPFGIALFAAIIIYDKKKMFAGVWVFLGMLSNYGEIHLFKYTIILAVLYFLCMFSIKRNKQLNSGKVMFFVMLSMLTGGQIYTYARGFLLYDSIIGILETIITLVGVYIFNKIIHVIIQPEKKNTMNNEEIISMVIFFSILIAGIFDYSVVGYSLKSIVSIFAILLFSYIGGPGMGSSIGVTIGILLSISSVVSPYIIGIYGFCGLLAGLLKRIGKFGTIFGFVIGNAILTFYINRSSETFIEYQEIIYASLLLCFIPGWVMRYLIQFVSVESPSSGSEKKSYSKKIKELITNRLKEFSNVFDELAITFNQVSDDNKILNYAEVADLFKNIAEKTCDNCVFYNLCWNREFYTTYQNLFSILTVLETKGVVEEEDMPKSFVKRCIRTKEVITSLNGIYRMYRSQYKWQKKVDESRTLITQQLKAVSKAVEGLASEIDEEIQFNNVIENELLAAFDKDGFKVKDVVAVEMPTKRIEIDIKRERCNGDISCIPTAEKIVSKTLGYSFICKIGKCMDTNNKECYLKLAQAQKLNITTGIRNLVKNNESISGDCYTFTPIKDERFLIAISDGMGTGQRAYKESNSTISLLEQFMEAGFDKETTIKTINSVLMLRSREEMFATLDLCILDLFTGITEFIKIGAAVSFIKRGEDVKCIRSNTLPIGIMNDIDVIVKKERVKDGDFVIMVSDGIIESIDNVENKEEKMMELLKKIKSYNPQTIADYILNMAIENCKGEIKDDMTVLVSKVWKTTI